MPENEDRNLAPLAHAVGERVPVTRGNVDPAVGGQSMANAFIALLVNSEGVEDDLSDLGAHIVAEAAERRQALLGEPVGEEGFRPALPAPDSARHAENPVAVADGTRVAWGCIASLPSYLMTVVRAQGREIFRSIPCYSALERELAPKGRDAMAEMQVLANVGGGGPHAQADIDRVARWIRDHGRPLDARTLTLPRIPGYNPRIILACDEERSFLLVSEPAFRGQQPSTYVYGWEGGMRFYRDRLEASDDLKALMVNRLLPAGMVSTAPALPAPPAASATASALPAVRRSPAAASDPVRRPRQRPPQAQPAPSAATGLAAAFMDIGFSKHGTVAGPELTRPTDDGGKATLVSAEDGVPLHKAGSLRLVVIDNDGELVGEAVVASVDDLDAALSPAPRP